MLNLGGIAPFFMYLKCEDWCLLDGIYEKPLSAIYYLRKVKHGFSVKVPVLFKVFKADFFKKILCFSYRLAKLILVDSFDLQVTYIIPTLCDHLL